MDVSYHVRSSIIKVDDPRRLTAARAEELIREERLTEMGRQARLFAAGRTWDNRADTFEDILKKAIEGKAT